MPVAFPDDTPDEVDTYSMYLDSKLWRMSSPDWPITPAEYQKVVDSIAPVQKKSRGPAPQGLTARLDPARNIFLTAAFQKDVGSQGRNVVDRFA